MASLQVSQTWIGAVVPLAAALVLGLHLAATGEADEGAPLSARGVGFGPQALLASGPHLVDADGDGLTDEQERVMGSSPFFADTDGDGFSDAEELARHSRPMDAKSTPLPAATDIGMTARGENGELRTVVAIYLADGNLASRTMQLGVVAAGRVVQLPPSSYLGASTIVQVPTAAPGGVVVLVDAPLDQRMVRSIGELSVFSTLVDLGPSVVVGAAAADLQVRDGVEVLMQEPRLLVSASTTAAALPMSGPGHTSLYNPIPPGGGGDIPATWTPGEICYQLTVPVAVSNGVVTHEVVGADCLEGWDASCRADCSASVGDTFRTFDPLGLVGY
ncbi:MAG: hypothetical protein H6828_07235 [Planctomycetes bacterium]|nr:hypothetical protein [Planctomycetota bacterium]